MYGLIGKLITAPGKRDQVIQIIGDSAVSMPGCMSYVLAKDGTDENVIWVTEVWDTQASHDNSLKLARVQKSIADARPFITGFERVAVTEPVRRV
jgi:quinol monooxygenase YgiN